MHYTLLEGLLQPIAENFKPQLVLVSAGYDAHLEDPLGGMRVTDEGFAALTSLLCDIATQYADSKLAMVLEGGYDLSALARGVHSSIDVMTGTTASPPKSPQSNQQASLINQIFAHHRTIWPHAGT